MESKSELKEYTDPDTTKAKINVNGSDTAQNKKEERSYVSKQVSRSHLNKQKKYQSSGKIPPSILAKHALTNTPLTVYGGMGHSKGYALGGTCERPRSSTPYGIRKLMRIVNLREVIQHS